MQGLLQNLELVAWLVGIFTITAFSNWLGVGRLIKILIDKNVVDSVNERTMHSGVVPRGGGLAIVTSLLLSMSFWAGFSDRPIFFLSLSIILFGWSALSWCDDKYDLSALFRGVVQLLLAAISVFLFGWVDQISSLKLAVMGPILSTIGIVWLANLNNFMDGMDGLAATQSIIANMTLGLWFFFLGDLELASVCLVVMAASYGFLLWNWHPAKIFMGDVGSVTLGAFYGCLIVIAVDRHDVPVLSLLLVFSVFIFDATYTVLNRVVKGESFWLPHRSHWYQRAGLASIPHNRVVLVAASMMCVSSLFATASLLHPSLLIALVSLTFAMLISACFGILKLEKSNKSNKNNSKT